ncbi:MFS transporter [Paraburkholderia unamae]|uniref:YNFM family putative membrane transporter n=1 Tax=Paraburkholderia unamae TaxID=219649 RepID=A0ABX5KQF4_9BURK|nr:MFS transporter [Paraburkholderia unamae]PVX84907.1 YNFM family putative membrane transporter [Paraburkholderia unamae]RAR65999.1 YNFM family putative membrane transporter [Paraburkholderia unamae]CAG9266616.1 putative transporter YnfM [Paraburkholderia unamae]
MNSPISAPARDASGVLPGSSAYRRIGVALFLAGFSTFSLLYCVQPLMPVFASEFHVGAAQSSLALSLSTGFLAVAILCAGALSERLGRRGLIFASMILAALFNVLAALEPGWHGVLVARALEGLALGGVPAVAMAYLAEEIEAGGLGLAMGLYVGGTAFGGMIGRVGMSYMSDHVSWRAAMLTIGVIDVIAAVVFLLLLPPSRRFVRRADLSPAHHVALWRKHLSSSTLAAVFATGCLAMGVFVTIYNYAGFRLLAPPFALDATQTGLIFCAYLFGIVAASVSGALADRWGRALVLGSGVAIAAIGVALTLFHTLAPVVLGIVVLTVGFFTTHSVASGWVGQLADGAKGHATSLYLLAYYLGSSVLGSWGGWFWQNGQWTAVAGFSFALLAGCGALAIVIARAQAGRAKASAS